MSKCVLCGKGPAAAHNVPKSQHKTNRLVQPNVQPVRGLGAVCTRCLRTLKRDLQTAA